MEIKKDKTVVKRKNWNKIIDKLNNSKSGRIKIEMGSPGSAQVTRTRIIKEYENLYGSTKGSTLTLWEE